MNSPILVSQAAWLDPQNGIDHIWWSLADIELTIALFFSFGFNYLNRLFIYLNESHLNRLYYLLEEPWKDFAPLKILSIFRWFLVTKT